MQILHSCLINEYKHIMSAKSVIQNLQDSDLIRIFLDFIQAYRLRYEKNHKEISYKCYEATWLIDVAKATGYGRTQTEAYKNALKNLLQLLMEDAQYVDYFATVVSQNYSKAIVKNPSPPPKMQLKTEGHDPDEKQKSQYDSYSRINLPGKAKQQVHYSKINLNRSLSQKGDIEMDEAKNKIKTLENKLAAILSENRVLRQKLINYEERPSFKKGNDDKRLFEGRKGLFLENQNPDKGLICLNKEKVMQLQRSQKSITQLQSKMEPSKVAIPKLNLQVLPNYHKKSQKCLNEVLLAAYNEKHSDKKML